MTEARNVLIYQAILTFVCYTIGMLSYNFLVVLLLAVRCKNSLVFRRDGRDFLSAQTTSKSLNFLTYPFIFGFNQMSARK